MILEVLPHPGELVAGFDPELVQVIGRADARQHQDLRRADRARAEQDLALGARRFAPPRRVR